MNGFFPRGAALSVIAIVAATGEAAAAQAICGKREAIVAELEKKYGETRRAFGLQQGRGIIEVWASERTRSWTILMTNAAGQTCMMAAGEAFETETVAQADTPV